MTVRFAIALLATSFALTVHADILVGTYDNPGSVRAFADDANGNVMPIRVIAGTSTGLASAAGGAFEGGEGAIYIADFFGQAIRVFPAYADGNAAPVRVLNSAQVGQARTVAIDPGHNEMIITNSGCCLAAYALTASGSDFALRRWAWGGGSGSLTQLNYPSGYAYAPGRDEILVSDHDNNYVPNILVFDRDTGTSYSTAAPKRVIAGNLTGLGDYAGGIAFDAVNDRLYVASYITNPDNSHSGRILVFAGDAGGNVAPLRIIAGASTQLETGNSGYPSGVAVDPVKDRLIVSLADYNSQAGNALLVFALGAYGNTAPLQAIRGAQTGLSNVGQPIWVPTNTIFADGFE